jgi:3-phosphoshikimate 1-carboxyvinyltransferase
MSNSNYSHTVSPEPVIRGELSVPGDKSISHRALILAVLANSTQTIRGLADGDDVRSTIDCVRALGCTVTETADAVTVDAGQTVGPVHLDAGNSGTTARLLSGVVAGMGIECTIAGDDSLSRRPMKRVADPLCEMGATISTSELGGLPMHISGGGLHAIEFSPQIASAQIKSAVLLAGIQSLGTTRVIESVPTRDHTERMLTAMGASVVTSDGVIVLSPSALHGISIDVPGDFSSAACFLVAGCCARDGAIKINAVNANPTRIGLVDVLKRMGARIDFDHQRSAGAEPVADLSVASSALRGIVLDDPGVIASIIDELPILAVAATQASGTTTIRGAGELRHKESDRINTIVKTLSQLGANITEHADGFTIIGGTPLRGGTVDSGGDHRIAMAMGIAGMFADGDTHIENAQVASVSYPGFFDDVLMLTTRGERT